MDVKLKSLRKEYGSTVALQDLTLQIDSGMFGLLGPNGAGKSTLMRILTTLLSPTTGTALVGGLDVTKHKREVRQLLGYLPQEFGLYRKLSAWELLDLIGSLKGIEPPQRRRREEVERVLRQVNLWDKRNQKVGGYSGGMKRRIGIAQALLGDPQLLIVDEPTAGLDPEERVRFRNLLTELSGDRVVILSTHIVGDIESSCNRLAVLRQGQLLFAGDQQELTNTASDQVWQVRVPERDLQRLKAVGRIVSTRREADQLSVRMIAQGNPFDLGEQVEPTLEDGYMALVGLEPNGGW